jgi:hypothetical protein
MNRLIGLLTLGYLIGFVWVVITILQGLGVL